jgi:carbamoyl-phosphate synthase large subunit
LNIVLSSVGRRSYLVQYFKDALNGTGKVIGTNTIAETTGMFACDIAEVVPPAGSPEYISSLLDICKKHSASMIFSLHDWEAPFLARNKQILLDNGVFPVDC